MATLSRTVSPSSASALWMPGALKSRSHSGVIQIRATKAAGWSWTEEYPPLATSNTDHMGLYAFLQKMWNRGEIHEATHPLTPGSGRSPNGLGTGGVTVSGGSQTGDTLLTTGWPFSTSNCVRAGDVIRIAGDAAVYMVSADAASNGSGVVDIPIHMPLRVSPSGGAAVTTSGVTFTVTLASFPQFPQGVAPHYFAGMNVTYVEAL